MSRAAAFTVTVTDAVLLPALLVAVRRYVVVCAGETDLDDPETEPTPLSMLSDVAPETVHERVVACPCVIAGGVAVNAEITGV